MVLTYLLFSLTSQSFAEEVIKSTDMPDLTEDEKAMYAKPDQRVTCMKLERITAEESEGPFKVNSNTGKCGYPNSVLLEDYVKIKDQELKPKCKTVVIEDPDGVNSAKYISRINVMFFKEKLYDIFLSNKCTFQPKNDKPIVVENYLMKCNVKGLKEKSLNVEMLRQTKSLDYAKLSDCFNSEKKEMDYSEIFVDKAKPVQLKSPRKKPTSGSI